MPTSIPYDPSLVLGNIVAPGTIQILENIATLQSNIDAEEDNLNSLISLKRSLAMTVQELTEMSVDPKAINDKMADVDKRITAAATAYAQAMLDNAEPIIEQKKSIRAVHQAPESPIDYNRTQIKTMPLAADSLKMNVQYFSFDSESQSAANFLSQIGGFVSNSLGILGDNFSSTASAEAKNQTSIQLENHDVVGTLVISIVCTHKNAAVLAPFIIDVDKAVRVWNAMFSQDKIEMTVAAMSKLVAEDEKPDAPAISLLSGASYGSSFVGMVHVLRNETTSSSQSMTSVAASMQEQFEVAGWFENESGGFGVDTSFSADIKNLLSSQNVTSHVSLITMGTIPSIKSNQVQIAVKQFAKFDPDEMMGKLAALSNATSADMQSISQSAAAAQSGGKMVALENAKVQSVMSSLGTIDDGQNKILDINSMMTALEDYVDKALQGNIGVPVNYYLKSITKLQIGQMWVAKYFPQKYIDYQGDDSAPAALPAPSQTDSAPAANTDTAAAADPAPADQTAGS